jgi:hypothetical protein
LRKTKLTKTRLLKGLTWFGAMVVAFIVVRAPWAATLRVIMGLALPCLQGALTAKNALSQSRLAQFSPVLVNIELVCAGLLTLSSGVALLGPKTLPVLYGSWVVAAIATLVLVIVAALDLIRAIGCKQNQRWVLIKLLLQSVALILYAILVLWMGFLVLIALSGKPYMGN